MVYNGILGYFENCRYRERKREKGIESKQKCSKVLTRNEREKQTQYWRVKQKESRERRNKKLEERKKKTERGKGKKDLTSNLKPWRKEIEKTSPNTCKIKIKQAIINSIKDNAKARKIAAKKLASLKKMRLNKYATTFLGIS